MPLTRRVPKRGFVNGAFHKDFAIVNLEALVPPSRRAPSSTRPPSGPSAWSRAGTTTASRSSATARSPRPSPSTPSKFSESAAAKIAAPAAQAIVVVSSPNRV